MSLWACRFFRFLDFESCTSYAIVRFIGYLSVVYSRKIITESNELQLSVSRNSSWGVHTVASCTVLFNTHWM